MNALLIQIRPEDTTRDHEFECILNKSGIDRNFVRRINAIDELPREDHLEGIDAIVIGGSGDYNVSNGDIPEQVEAIGGLIQSARRYQIPTLAICFGAQVMAHVLGGRVEKDVDREELGTFTITKNDYAADCPIFSPLPSAFDVQLGHSDHITTLPKGAINLASSERSEIQAFTFPGEFIYGFTFHPELDAEDIHWRLDYYAKHYGLSEEKIEQLKQATISAEHGAKPLQEFFEQIVKQRKMFLR